MDKMCINIKIKIDMKKRENCCKDVNKTIITSLYKNHTLEKQFIDLMRSKEKEVEIKNKYRIKLYYYLLQKEERELQGNKKISELNLNHDDIILVTNYKKKK